MVRFCSKCKRAVDDLDKFCRSCGHDTEDSIDYHTYYRLPGKDDNSQQSLIWFIKGADIALRQEIEKINEKVDVIHKKLFPPSVDELRKEFERVLKKKGENEEEELIEKPSEKEIESRTEDKIRIEESSQETNVGDIQETKAGDTQETNVGDIQEIKVEGNQEINAEEFLENKNPNLVSVKELLEDKDIKKDEWAWREDIEKGEKTGGIVDVHEEVDNKLDSLLKSEDSGQMQAIQYLIDRYSKNKSTDNKSSPDNLQGDDNSMITIIPKEDVVKVGRVRGRGKGESRSIYHDAIFKFIPDILKEIENSKDGKIRIKVSDIAKKMGDQFVGKKTVTIYTGLKYSLFDHNIVVEQGTLKEIDPLTQENVKVLIMRMKNPDDKLPPSMQQRKGDKLFEIEIEE